MRIFANWFTTFGKNSKIKWWNIKISITCRCFILFHRNRRKKNQNQRKISWWIEIFRSRTKSFCLYAHPINVNKHPQEISLNVFLFVCTLIWWWSVFYIQTMCTLFQLHERHQMWWTLNSSMLLRTYTIKSQLKSVWHPNATIAFNVI